MQLPELVESDQRSGRVGAAAAEPAAGGNLLLQMNLKGSESSGGDRAGGAEDEVCAVTNQRRVVAGEEQILLGNLLAELLTELLANSFTKKPGRRGYALPRRGGGGESFGECQDVKEPDRAHPAL